MKCTARQRFDSKFTKGPDCWEWQGPLDKKGYGSFFWNGRETKAPRAAWILERGEIPPGISVCHSCDNPRCVRVSHLWLGTQAENLADMTAKGRRRSWPNWTERTHCQRGHEYTPDNSYVYHGVRSCRVCRRLVNRRTLAAHPERQPLYTRRYLERKTARAKSEITLEEPSNGRD